MLGIISNMISRIFQNIKFFLHPLYFYDTDDANLWEKKSSAAQLIHAKKCLYRISSFYEKKPICNKHSSRINNSRKTFSNRRNLWIFVKWNETFCRRKIFGLKTKTGSVEVLFSSQSGMMNMGQWLTYQLA